MPFGAVEEHGDQGGAHAVEVGVLVDGVADEVVAAVDSAAHLVEEVVSRLVVVQGEMAEMTSCEDFTGCVPSHAVCERQKARPGVHRVFVVSSHKPHVGAGGILEN
ncbi:MAG: hypothetical protein U1U88_001402 [Lawsonella clevelandensis]